MQSHGNLGLKLLLKFFSLSIPAKQAPKLREKLRRKLREKLRPELPRALRNGNFAQNFALQKPFAKATGEGGYDMSCRLSTKASH